MPGLSLDGRRIEFRSGDTIAAALHRAGVRILSRSFKYHRRRGLYCLTGDCPNCLVTVNDEPAVRACCTEAVDGQRVRRENAWPSADVDLFGAAWFFRRFLPVGWYYKTMTRPWMWRLGEPLLRRAAGLARVPREPRAADRVAVHLHADLAVAGGGVAGLSAAAAAADRGDTVVVADEGGFGDKVPPGPTRDRIDELVRTLRAQAGVTLLEYASVVGIYEGPLVPMVAERYTYLVHPARVVVATGAVESHGVFPGCDLPGVWLGRGAARMAGVHGVRPGEVAVVVGHTDESPGHLAVLQGAGVRVAAVLAPARLAGRFPPGVPVWPDAKVTAARGRTRVTAVTIAAAAGETTIACDALVLSLGLQPRGNLLRQAVTEPVAGAGEVVDPGCPLDAAVESGRRAGVSPARAAAFDERSTPLDATAVQPPDAGPLPQRGSEGFVCLCEDVGTADLAVAWAEGFRSTELLKRYTTVTMGPCQGALCHGHLRAFVADRSPDSRCARPTIARPPARPVRVSEAAAGLGYATEQRTALHARHLEAGGHMTWFGEWKRPAHYGDPRPEYDAVRHAVSIMDVGTLGKFLIAGPDATAFLDRLFPSHVRRIAPGRLRYTLWLNEAGYIFDDGLVCRMGPERYYVTSTTAGADRGEAWMKDWADTWGLRVHIVNRTASAGAINVAGPMARELLSRLGPDAIDAEALPAASHRELSVAGVPCLALRVGFVGELSFELHHPSGQSVRLWDALREQGAAFNLVPHGVDTLLQLRLEKGHIVIGMDTDFDTTPAKAGLEWAVRMDKDDFVGRTALERLAGIPSDKRLAGFEFDGEAAPAPGTALTVAGRYVGYLSSSGFSAALGRPVALGWVRRTDGEFPTAVMAGGHPGRRVATPFYDPEGTRVRG